MPSIALSAARPRDLPLKNRTDPDVGSRRRSPAPIYRRARGPTPCASGSGAPRRAMSPAASQRMPSGAAAVAGTCARYTTSSSGKCVNTWVTTPARRRQVRLPAPARNGEARRLGERPPGRNRRETPWSAPRSCRRAGPSRAASAPGDGRRRAAPRRRRRGAAALRASSPCAETSRDRRAAAPRKRREGAQRTGGILGRADGGAEVHHRLGEIAGPLRRPQPLRQGADRGLGSGQFVLDGIKARDHPFHIAVDRARAAARTRSRRSRPPYRGRCRAARAGPPRPRERRPPWRAATAWAQAWRLRARA